MARALSFVPAIAAAALVAVAATGIALAQEASPPRTYEGEIETVSDLCGGGAISVTTDGETSYVSGITFAGFNVTGDGETSLPLSGDATFDPNTVPVRDDGSFDGAYFPTPYPGQLEILVTGQFDGDELTGFITFSGSPICGAVPYSAALAEQATPSISLPTSGRGPDGGSGGGLPLWFAAALVAGALLVAGGLLATRRAA